MHDSTSGWETTLTHADAWKGNIQPPAAAAEEAEEAADDAAVVEADEAPAAAALAETVAVV
jgi:hypothetical protein